MEENSNLQLQLNEIDEKIEELQKQIDMGKALEELHNNDAFKTIILDGLFTDEAERIFGVLTNPNTFKRDIMENLQDKLGSIRIVKQYFGVILQNAAMAPEQMEEEKRYRQELTARASDDSEVIDTTVV
jgi:hypothetical protein